jgi:hypothetical protein
MSIVGELLVLIGKIPASFWGVVVGSFFSLGGIVAVNRANDRRLREQHEHDREMRNRDRELSLRKDVYLSAAEAVSAGITAIGRFADLEIPNNQLTQAFVDKSPAIAKVNIIAEELTVEALTNLLGELSAVYLRLFAKRFPLVALRDQILRLQEQIARSSREKDRMVELMKQFNLDGTIDPNRYHIIESVFKFEQDCIAETSKQHAMLSADISVKQLQFMKECVHETNRMSRLTVPAIVFARAELEMPINEQVYSKIIENSIAKQKDSLEAFMEDIQK